MNKEDIRKIDGRLVENGKILRGISKKEAAHFGLDEELVQFLNILAQREITLTKGGMIMETGQTLWENPDKLALEAMERREEEKRLERIEKGLSEPEPMDTYTKLTEFLLEE